MKRCLPLFAMLLMAVPLLAQEGGEGGFGGMFGMGDAPRAANTPPPDRLVQLRKIMVDAKTPLTQDQEKQLSSMLENEIKKYTDELEKKYPEEVAQARAAGVAGQGEGRAAGRGGERGGFAAGGGGGRRGGPAGPAGRGGRGSGLPLNSPLLEEMNRINAELQAKVTAALKPEQQTAFQRFQNDEIKKAGGFPAFKLSMQEAGTPLTVEQEMQVQALYAEQDQQRRQLMREAVAQGSQPDRARVDAQLNAELTPKLVRILNAEQRKALLEAMRKQAPR